MSLILVLCNVILLFIDKSLSPASAAAAAAEPAVNSEERAAAETTPNENISYEER